MPKQICLPFDTEMGAITQAMGDNDLIPVKVTTYEGEYIQSVRYYAYEMGDLYPDLREDFPRVLHSNQSIEELAI